MSGDVEAPAEISGLRGKKFLLFALICSNSVRPIAVAVAKQELVHIEECVTEDEASVLTVK